MDAEREKEQGHRIERDRESGGKENKEGAEPRQKTVEEEKAVKRETEQWNEKETAVGEREREREERDRERER